MLHHGEELDVREAEVFYIGRQPVGHLAVRQGASMILRHARPRPEMHLVDRHRAPDPLARLPARPEPLAITPLVA